MRLERGLPCDIMGCEVIIGCADCMTAAGAWALWIWHCWPPMRGAHGWQEVRDLGSFLHTAFGPSVRMQGHPARRP